MEDSDRLPRKLAAILYADVAGYSRLTGQDEDATHRTLTEYLDLIANSVESHRGRVMHYAGDAVLAMFEAGVDALSCATSIQRDLQIRNTELPDNRKVNFRIGVNLGDVIEDRGDIYGDGVNVAARLENLAEPGGICISDAVRTAVGTKLSIDYEYLGEMEVKNITEPVRAYRPSLFAPTIGDMKTAGSKGLEVPDKPSIAVLPFTNMSGDPEQEYFSDGITEDIITELSRFSMLFVIARHSSFAFKGQVTNVKDLSEKLGVQYIVEGSVRRAANRVRITAQLIDVGTGTHIWAERYDGAIEDVFDVQDEVTNAIVATLPGQIEKAVVEHAGRKRTESMTAYDCLLRGNRHYHLFTRADLLEAKCLYQKAIELDPQFAQAYSRLADTYNSLATLGLEANATLAETLEIARKAVALDSGDNWARLALAWALVRCKQFDEAEEQFEKALALNRNDADCICWAANGLICLGRAEEGLKLISEAMRLNPLHPNIYHNMLGNGYYFTGRYEDAVREYRHSGGFEWLDHANLAAAYGQLGRSVQAQDEAKRFVEARKEQLEANGEALPVSDLELAAPKMRRFRHHADRDRYLDGLRKAGLSD